MLEGRRFALCIRERAALDKSSSSYSCEHARAHEAISVFTIDERRDAIRRRHFQDSLLPRGLTAKELASRLLVRVSPLGCVRECPRPRMCPGAGKYSCVSRSISSKMATKNPTNTIAATSNPSLLRLGEWAQKRGDVTTGMIVNAKDRRNTLENYVLLLLFFFFRAESFVTDMYQELPWQGSEVSDSKTEDDRTKQFSFSSIQSSFTSTHFSE